MIRTNECRGFVDNGKADTRHLRATSSKFHHVRLTVGAHRSRDCRCIGAHIRHAHNANIW